MITNNRIQDENMANTIPRRKNIEKTSNELIIKLFLKIFSIIRDV